MGADYFDIVVEKEVEPRCVLLNEALALYSRYVDITSDYLLDYPVPPADVLFENPQGIPDLFYSRSFSALLISHRSAEDYVKRFSVLYGIDDIEGETDSLSLVSDSFGMRMYKYHDLQKGFFVACPMQIDEETVLSESSVYSNSLFLRMVWRALPRYCLGFLDWDGEQSISYPSREIMNKFWFEKGERPIGHTFLFDSLKNQPELAAISLVGSYLENYLTRNEMFMEDFSGSDAYIYISNHFSDILDLLHSGQLGWGEDIYHEMLEDKEKRKVFFSTLEKVLRSVGMVDDVARLRRDLNHPNKFIHVGDDEITEHIIQDKVFQEGAFAVDSVDASGKGYYFEEHGITALQISRPSHDSTKRILEGQDLNDTQKAVYHRICEQYDRYKQDIGNNYHEFQAVLFEFRVFLAKLINQGKLEGVDFDRSLLSRGAYALDAFDMITALEKETNAELTLIPKRILLLNLPVTIPLERIRRRSGSDYFDDASYYQFLKRKWRYQYMAKMFSFVEVHTTIEALK